MSKRKFKDWVSMENRKFKDGVSYRATTTAGFPLVATWREDKKMFESSGYYFYGLLYVGPEIVLNDKGEW